MAPKPKRKRNYAKENKLRKARESAFGKAKGVSAELIQIKRAVKSEYRRTFGRKQAARLVSQAAGIKHPGPLKQKVSKREFEKLDNARDSRKKFIEKFLELELGTEHEAYTLWYSP